MNNNLPAHNQALAAVGPMKYDDFEASFIGALSTHVPEEVWEQCLQIATIYALGGKVAAA